MEFINKLILTEQREDVRESKDFKDLYALFNVYLTEVHLTRLAQNDEAQRARLVQSVDNIMQNAFLQRQASQKPMHVVEAMLLQVIIN